MVLHNKNLLSKFCRVIQRLLIQQQGLSSLTLSEVQCLNTECCSILAEGMAASSSLNKVALVQCALDGPRLSVLARGLKTPLLQVLDLTGSQLGDDSMEVICSVLAWH